MTLGNSPFHTCNSGFPDCLDYRCPKICGLRWALEPSLPSTREEGNLGVKAPTTTLLGPKRLWIIIVNIIIIIIIIVGWALRACVILRGLGRALGPSAKATSKYYRALRT